jgi:hypothetical protein
MVSDYLTQAVLIGLATGYLVRAWQTGELFAPIIAELETGCLSEWAYNRYGDGKMYKLTDKLEYLLQCPLCLSPYVAGFLWLLISTAPFVGYTATTVFAAAQIAFWLRTRE